MRYVLDSSVALKWVLPEPLSDKARQLRTDFENAALELLAPDILPVECGHALTRAERRGLILIDPPFEEVSEFARLAHGLEAAHRKWAGGSYLLWYPIKPRQHPDSLMRRLRRSGPPCSGVKGWYSKSSPLAARQTGLPHQGAVGSRCYRQRDGSRISRRGCNPSHRKPLK